MRRRSESRPRLFQGFLSVAAVLLLAACAPPETHPDAARTPSGAALYSDGVYSAAYSHADNDGWRPFLMLEVEAGLITALCFDAVNSDGMRLLEDEATIERLRLSRGVHLPDLVEQYRGRVIESQRTIGVVEPRALEWALYFQTLLRSALSAAEEGPTPGGRAAAQQAPLEVVMQGPYVVTDDPDKLGWEAELITVHDGQGAVAAHYLERRRAPDGEQRKRDDPLYDAEYEAALGLSFSSLADGVAASLTGRALAGQDGKIVEAVSGATLSTRRADSLAARIADRRRAVALPRRLCR